MNRFPKVRSENLTFGVFFMAKYSFEFKLKTVREYLVQEVGMNSLAKKYAFKINTQICFQKTVLRKVRTHFFINFIICNSLSECFIIILPPSVINRFYEFIKFIIKIPYI